MDWGRVGGISCERDRSWIELVSGRDSNRSGYYRLPCEVVSSLCLQTDALLAQRDFPRISPLKGSLNYMLSAMVLLFFSKGSNVKFSNVCFS